MKRKTIVLPTSTDDLRANAIVGFSKGKPTKNWPVDKIMKKFFNFSFKYSKNKQKKSEKVSKLIKFSEIPH